MPLEKLIELCIDQIIILHGVPITIVLDQDSQLVS